MNKNNKCEHGTHFKDTVTKVTEIEINHRNYKKSEHEKIKLLSAKTVRKCFDCNFEGEVIFA